MVVNLIFTITAIRFHMHRFLLALVFSSLIFPLMGAVAFADAPLIEVTPDPMAPLPDNAKTPPSPAQPYPWADLGPQNYGHNYQVYIPREMKSDSPDALRTYDPSGYPRAGLQQTPEGRACATDADCKAPLGCFPRADSGLIPVKLCAYPPPY
jgi:hypothetical protein